MRKTSILSLPVELLTYIFSKLTPHELCILAQVSSYFKWVAEDDLLWNKLMTNKPIPITGFHSKFRVVYVKDGGRIPTYPLERYNFLKMSGGLKGKGLFQKIPIKRLPQFQRCDPLGRCYYAWRQEIAIWINLHKEKLRLNKNMIDVCLEFDVFTKTEAKLLKENDLTFTERKILNDKIIQALIKDDLLTIDTTKALTENTYPETVVRYESIATAFVKALRSGDHKTMDDLLKTYPKIIHAIHLIRLYEDKYKTPYSKRLYEEVDVLIEASRHKQADIVKQLVAAGANPNAKDIRGLPILQRLLRYSINDKTATTDLLIRCGADPNGRSLRRGNTLLHTIFISFSDNKTILKLAKLLLAHNAEPNSINKDGETPLNRFGSYGEKHIEFPELLLISGANPNIANNKRETILHKACEHGNSKMVALLLRYHAVPNAKDNLGQTPLHKACRHGNVDIVEQLLLHGANTEETDLMGNTPLHLACASGWEAKITQKDALASNDIKIVDLLLFQGADPVPENNQREMPFQIDIPQTYLTTNPMIDHVSRFRMAICQHDFMMVTHYLHWHTHWAQFFTDQYALNNFITHLPSSYPKRHKFLLEQQLKILSKIESKFTTTENPSRSNEIPPITYTFLPEETEIMKQSDLLEINRWMDKKIMVHILQSQEPETNKNADKPLSSIPHQSYSTNSAPSLGRQLLNSTILQSKRQIIRVLIVGNNGCNIHMMTKKPVSQKNTYVVNRGERNDTMQYYQSPTEPPQSFDIFNIPHGKKLSSAFRRGDYEEIQKEIMLFHRHHCDDCTADMFERIIHNQHTGTFCLEPNTWTHAVLHADTGRIECELKIIGLRNELVDIDNTHACEPHTDFIYKKYFSKVDLPYRNIDSVLLVWDGRCSERAEIIKMASMFRELNIPIILVRTNMGKPGYPYEQETTQILAEEVGATDTICCSAETGVGIDQLKAKTLFSTIKYRIPQLFAYEVNTIITKLRECSLSTFGINLNEKANKLDRTLKAVLASLDCIHMDFNHPAQICNALLAYQPYDSQGNAMSSIYQLLKMPYTAIQKPLPYLNQLYQFINELENTVQSQFQDIHYTFRSTGQTGI